ncbi:hypothetical protein Bca4012_083771 [Brassica carinata]
MDSRKGIVLGLAAVGVKPQFKQQQPQHEAVNTAQRQRPIPEPGQSSGGNGMEEITRAEFRSSQGYHFTRIEEPEPGQSSGGNDVEEITRANFRRSQGYHLTRIEEPEEDIDPGFLNFIRSMNARHSAPVRRPQHGQSSRAMGSRQA